MKFAMNVDLSNVSGINHYRRLGYKKIWYIDVISTESLAYNIKQKQSSIKCTIVRKLTNLLPSNKDFWMYVGYSVY